LRTARRSPSDSSQWRCATSVLFKWQSGVTAQ
jgi:hypothetical protein